MASVCSEMKTEEVVKKAELLQDDESSQWEPMIALKKPEDDRSKIEDCVKIMESNPENEFQEESDSDGILHHLFSRNFLTVSKLSERSQSQIRKQYNEMKFFGMIF